MKIVNIIVACSFLLFAATANAAMLEINTAPGAKTEVIKGASKQELDDSLVRTQALQAHTRQQWTESGCPALSKADQCIKLLDVLLEIVKHVGPSGASGNVTVTNSSFVTYATPDLKNNKK